MAYGGYLIKVGEYVIPHKYIKADTYSATLNGQDLESYRDADGLLHRNALEHKVCKVEFETVPMLTDKDLDTLLGNIEKQYIGGINDNEKALNVTFYIPERRAYVMQKAYMTDPEISPYWADSNMIQYNSFRLAFIGY